MTSKTDIANDALLKIGCTLVNDLDDPVSPEAGAVNQVYEAQRKKLLRLHNWKFALKRADLAELCGDHPHLKPYGPRHAKYGPRIYRSDNPMLPPLKRRFALPQDFIKLDRVIHPRPANYQIEGKTLRVSAHRCEILYVWDNQNSNDFDYLFLDCLSHMIAAQIAYKLTGAEAKGQALKQELELMLREAKRVDSIESDNPPLINCDELIASRFGWDGYSNSYYD